jgi:hypothetical protein
MHFLLAAALTIASLRGSVTYGGGALPGVTVKLWSSAGESITVTDAQGVYRFATVRPGSYSLRIACGASACADTAPKSAWDWPLCTDYELDSSLIESIENGDRSAVDLARRRHDAAFTYREKHRLAATLLGQVPIDTAYWNELMECATNAVRFASREAEPSEDFVRWCAERDLDPDDYAGVTFVALGYVSSDHRAKSLLHDALKAPDYAVAWLAIEGFAKQHDESVLPEIDRALEAFPDQRRDLAGALGDYRTDAADQLARKYLDDGDFEEYQELRANPDH